MELLCKCDQNSLITIRGMPSPTAESYNTPKYLLVLAYIRHRPYLDIMLITTTILAFVTLAMGVSVPSMYVDWRTFKATGVNFGGQLAQEAWIDSQLWTDNTAQAVRPADIVDEWSLYLSLGSECGPVLEERYATFIQPVDIDQLAHAGVNILRFLTTYAAQIELPGSALYSGNQTKYLKTIATYAIEEYNMYIIIDIHPVPGGVNGVGVGEATNHFSWFDNMTALQ